jgi:signal transduction histidine kinase
MRDAFRQEVPWRLGVVAVGALLVAVAAVGVAGISVNRNVESVVERAIAFDVELEDNADDLRVAVLDLRHFHRNLIFGEPLGSRVEKWEERYGAVLAEIDELEALIATGVDPVGLPTTDELRALAEGYYLDFRPAIDAYDPDDRTAFEMASDTGLAQLDALESLTEVLDKEGEARAAKAFRAIGDAISTGNWILIVVLAGLTMVGGALGLAVLRMIQTSRRLVIAQQNVSRAKTDFIAEASHELRTPLTVLRGNAELGLVIEDERERSQILRKIVAETQRMSSLVNDLLFLTRSDATSVPLDLQNIDARELLEEVGGRAEMLIRERPIALATAIDVAGTLRADVMRLEQAVLILVDNAANYSPPGESVDLRARLENEMLVIEVHDRGPGIPQQERARIFERFFRGDGQPSHRASGAGLGLAIALANVKGHGGTIAAEDRRGGGTTMRIRLPILTSPWETDAPGTTASGSIPDGAS